MDKKNTSHNVYLGLGSNLGDKEANLYLAVKNIEERIGQLKALSAFYLTAPVGFLSDNQFLNAACLIETSFTPIEVLDISKSIELDMGRKSKSCSGIYADRIIDIDILLYDDYIINSSELILPHPHLHNRGFVIRPLSEIATTFIHPTLNKSIEELENEYIKRNPE